MAKSILITGASSGIGDATARHFLSAGWNVGLLGRRKEMLEAVADGNPNALLLPFDVADPDQVDEAFAAFKARFGNIDVLFNNAGVSAPGRTIDEIPLEDWKRSVDVNLTGSFLCARAAFKAMRAQDPQGGRIINNGSISAHVPRPGSVPYTTTKHGITGLTRTLSLDGRPYNIACSQIDIGNALTPMAAKMQDGVPQADLSIKAEAMMDVNHIADAVLHMSELPLATNVQFMTIMATAMPFIGRG